jgi:uridylate kinase
MTQAKYKRVLLKMSGEALMGDSSYGINESALTRITDDIIAAHETGVEMGLVIGGGNIFRGMKAATETGMDRSVADAIGMLATIMNALAFQDALEQKGVDTRVMTAFPLAAVAEPYIRRRAIHHLEEGRVLILAAGTGHPYFTTDTAAALRAAELKAEVLIKATQVDGVYDKDPRKFTDAKRYDQIDWGDVLSQNLGVMDATAVSLCRSCSLPIIVFDLSVPGNIIRVLSGQDVGTRIGDEI